MTINQLYNLMNTAITKGTAQFASINSAIQTINQNMATKVDI